MAKHYYVTYNVTASCIIEVDADSVKEAEALANEKMNEANIGDFQEVEYDGPIMIESD